MDRPERSGAFLPDDALVEILSRLPAKSLCRFKCVSKAWCDLIGDRLRCNKLPQTLAGFFIYDEDGGGKGDGGGVISDRIVYGSFIDTLGGFVPLASFTFLGKQPEIKEFGLLHSCNGLLLFGHKRASDTYDSLGYIVCNPATEQWVAVPNSGWKPSWKPFFLLDLDESDDSDLDLDESEDSDFVAESDCALYTYLICDPAVSSHFQLVQFWMQPEMDDVEYLDQVHIYSSETGVWCDKVRFYEWSEDEGVDFFAGSALVNGTLHVSVGKKLIVAIDGEGNDCRIISGLEKRADVVFVGQSQGRLHYMTQHRDNTREMTELSIWVLQDYDTGEWVLKHSVTSLQLFGRKSCRALFDYKVVDIHPDHNLIFFVQHWDLNLKSYDMDSKEVCTLRTLRVPQDIFPYVPYYAESLALANKH